jgi:fructokinase
VVKVSAEDLAWLAPDESPSHVARRWQALGPKIVIVTLREVGALAVMPNGQEINRPSPHVELVDTVGAGDAFTAGLLAAKERNELLRALNRSALAALSPKTLATVIDEAALVTAITCSRRGADSPTRDQVTAYDRNRSKRSDTPPLPAAGPLARAE